MPQAVSLARLMQNEMCMSAVQVGRRWDGNGT